MKRDLLAGYRRGGVRRGLLLFLEKAKKERIDPRGVGAAPLGYEPGLTL